MNTTRLVRLSTLLLVVAIFIAGCGSQSSVEPVFAFSEAIVGPNRIALGIVKDNTPVNDPDIKVTMRFLYLEDNNPEVKEELEATYFGQGMPVGYYVTYPTFDQPGNWGIEVETQLPDEANPSTKRLQLQVQEDTWTPNIGDEATSVETLTVDTAPTLEHLSSGSVIDESMYQVSLDEAIESGQPTVVLFATPAYCRTATCAPSLSVVEDLQKEYGEQMNFIHSEVYRYPFGESFNEVDALMQQAMQMGRTPSSQELRAGYSDAMAAWNLPSEPWLFLIDADGTIAARFEGGITTEELAPALEQLLSGETVLFEG
ncbi:MAG: thioredoxin family protein [Chloroflexota bacterium]